MKKTVSDRRDLLAETLCICFVQQDMEFVTGAPEQRRRFFDQTLAFFDFSFLDLARGYREVLRSRNFCLKSRQTGLLDAYDEQLATLGLQLSQKRYDLVTAFNGSVSAAFPRDNGRRACRGDLPRSFVAEGSAPGTR